MRPPRLSPIVVAALALAGPVAAQQGDPCEVHVTPADGVNRWLPHAFHDQAMESLQAMHPEHRILAERHSGRIGAIGRIHGRSSSGSTPGSDWMRSAPCTRREYRCSWGPTQATGA